MKAAVIKTSMKVNDCFRANIYDNNNNCSHEYEGYVPEFFPGNHYGDYVELTIDLEEGIILNWPKNLTPKDFFCLIVNDNNYDEDDEDNAVSHAYLKEFGSSISSLKTKLKVSDRFSCQIFNKEYNLIGEYRGYVPKIFPDNNYGDNVSFNIDVKTGKILNWKKPVQEIEEFEDIINPE